MRSLNRIKNDSLRSPFPSPAHSRAASPFINRHRHRYAETLDDSHSRSRSRARPGRKVSIDVPTTLNDETNSTTRRTHNARFSSPVPKFHQETQPTPPAPAENFAPPSLDYPRDERGQEASTGARIWHIYADVAVRADSLMTEGWNRSMDVLLVFTGLFSAVLTTFIIQSYQLMIPDPVETTNVLLAQLLALQGNGVVAQTIIGSNTLPSSSSEIHWVNGLWFAALACSLSTALISMLAKQWLQGYPPNSFGTAQQRARLRQSSHMQLQAWHVPAIINALPLLLHIALLLFFAGLVMLLWSVDFAITLATWAIVAFAYAFYFTSMLLPLVYPNCPYKHPVSEYLREWMSSRKPGSSYNLYSRTRKGDVETGGIQVLPITEKPCDAENSQPALAEDILDARALAWLFSTSADSDVIAAAVQAIAGLPQDFSAFQVLRDAGALHLIVQGFQDCFQKDTAIDLQWHLIDAEAAELFCRAWIKLTRGTNEQWPFDIVEPLWMLQDLQTHPDVGAIASCAVALSSLDSHMSQWELLSYLAKYAAGEVQLSQETQCCLLNSIIECVIAWEMPIAVIEETTIRAVPVLLRLLHLTEDMPTSNVRGAIALALHVFTGGHVDLMEYRSVDRRRSSYCELMLEALSSIIENPDRFGVKDGLADIVAQELCRLATPVVAQSERFPRRLKTTARSSLSKLYIDGSIGVGLIPDKTLADVLHLLFPPIDVSQTQRPVFVTTLVETLEMTTHPDVTGWAIRILEVLLTRCTVSVADAFISADGIAAVLQAAKIGDVDSRRLQIDCLRTVSALIDSSTGLHTQEDPAALKPLEKQYDAVFKSEFFDTLCSVIASRRWWLYEVSGHWMPTLVKLCYIRPDESVWKTVVTVFRDFAERNAGEEGYMETLYHLSVITKVSSLSTDQAVGR